MTDLKQFEKQQYLCLETFRKNGEGVKTPVWFARENDQFFIWTGGSSGKVKRIHNNSRVRVAPSKVDGTPVGEWIEAFAVADPSDAAIKHVSKLFIKKYGLMFRMYATAGSLRKMERATVKLEFKV